MTPMCFDSPRQYAAWVEAARQAPPAEHDGYCTDCLPTYKERMMAEGRCGHPGVTFEIIAHEGCIEIEGRRP